ncbi:MAG TPA: hypothetical protein DCS55_19080 [Acidimicrobiaceae bacterium]|nr:hypothetical protein [Acidimicrobiaceae bacterium]
MSSQSEVDRLRKEIQGLQQKIAGESAKVATSREKEASNRERASKASTASSASSRSKEADRQVKSAVAAEKRRAELEKKLAAKQKSLHTAEARLGKKRDEEQKRAIKTLQTRASAAERQFRPSHGELFSAPAAPSTPLAHDVFISHASEDKQAVARPLADLLIDRDVEVWYDDFTLTVGDSLRRSIDRGLAGSRFGVIILSPDFFRKEWPQAELDGLVAKQRASGAKVILPIWHRLTRTMFSQRVRRLRTSRS